MSYKIILADLEKYLFPEVYPFYKSHFDLEKELLAHKVPLDKLNIQNISFKIKLTNFCCKVEDTSVRYILQSLFNKHVDNHLDWHKSYDWNNLKSILMFFVVFSTVKNETELKGIFNVKPLPTLFSKYFPKNQKKEGTHYNS